MKRLILLSTLLAYSLAEPLFEVHASTSGPMPIGSFAAATGTGGSFFTFGGAIDNLTDGTFEFSNDLWRFQIDTVHSGSWEQIQPNGPIPSARGFHLMEKVVDDEGHAYLLLFGGAQFDDFFQAVAQDQFYIYDILANTWEDASNLGGPGPRSLACGSAKGSKLYVTGGLNDFFGTETDIWEFDINTRQWTQLPEDFPGQPRYASACGLLDDTFVLYGGEGLVVSENGVEFIFPDDTWEYSLIDNIWTEIHLSAHKNLVPRRNFLATAVSKTGKRLKVVGGDLEGGESGCGSIFEQNISDETNVYHTQGLKRWQKRPTHIPPLKRHAAVQVGVFMYIVGGYDFICSDGVGPGQVWNNKVYATINP